MVIETPYVTGVEGQLVQVTHYTRSNAPNRRPRGPTPLCTSRACNPSAEWGLAPSHRSTPSNVYVEDDSDRVCESRLGITRELDQCDGYCENQSILLTTVEHDPQLPRPALP
ncbi:hypothetical protein CRG98_027828 [Punica granatum]|uniref:Uncharacterized protein n=1 Tax=Punica granatum TaxID=22663 RepID=A0A2I0J7B6_PUNGR|nr:hypothetical protein CRG98_027828 [Punica granatum]